MTDTIPETGNPHADRTNNAVEIGKKRCNYCKGLIVWTRTEARHDAAKLPVDYPSVTTGGNVLLVHDDRWGLIATVLGTPKARHVYQCAGWRLYLHHRLTCPHAAQWSGKTPTRTARPKRSRA